MRSLLSLVFQGLMFLLIIPTLSITASGHLMMRVDATPPSLPPTTLYGTLMISGYAALDGTPIEVSIDGVVAATTSVFSQGGFGGRYQLDLFGRAGQTVTFRSGAYVLTPDAILGDSGPQFHNLSGVASGGTATPTATGTPTAAGTPTGTGTLTVTRTATITGTPTGTGTPTATQSASATGTPTATGTRTGSNQLRVFLPLVWC